MVNNYVKPKEPLAEHYHVKYDGFLQKLFKLILAEERRSVRLTVLRIMAALLARFYGILVNLRNRLFDFGVLRSHKLACHVISVGNVVMGGTGKTPMVLWLARFLIEEGWRVAIVSRGYGRDHGGRLLIVSDGKRILADSLLSGDEPQLLARRLPGLPVLCSPNRVAAVETAIEQFQSEVVILDDGFQHRYLARDLDVLMLDALKPFGNGRLFPRGMLREDTIALARAHTLVLSRFDGSRQAEQNRENLVRRWSDKPIFAAMRSPGRLIEAVTGRERPLSSLEKVRAAAFAGIARPDDFFNILTDLGTTLVCAYALPDHHCLTSELLESFVRETASLKPELWVITEKDWVRLPESLPENMQVWVLTVELDFGEQSPQFRAMVQRSLLKPSSAV